MQRQQGEEGAGLRLEGEDGVLLPPGLESGRVASRTTLYRLIALAGYTAYTNCLAHDQHSPVIRDFFKRTTNPEPGDLVLETTTFWGWSRHETATPGAALGFLLREVWEPVITEKQLREMHATGDYYDEPNEGVEDIPKERVYYIAPLDGCMAESRWRNATFIAIPTDNWQAWRR